MRLIFHGELKNRFGDSVVMFTETVADAIEGYSRQVNWPVRMRVSVIAGVDRLDTLSKLNDYHDEVHLIPTLSGGSGKFTNIILGAALIVGGILSGGFATPIGTSLIISGSLVIAQGVIALFMKAPKVQSVNDPEASKYLNVNKNTTEVGTLMTMAWGRIDLAGQWVSIQSDSNNLAIGVFPAQLPSFVWTKALTDGIAENEGVLTKTSTDDWRGAVSSVETFLSNVSVSFKVMQNNKYLMVALNGDPSTDTSYYSLDYAVYLDGNGEMQIFTSGSSIGPYGSYSSGDTFKIARNLTEGKVNFYRNGNLFASINDAGNPLGLDSSFYTTGGSISELVFSNTL